MNRAIKTIRNIILIGVLITVFLATTGLRLTPIQAHKASEKGIHYGPSEIIKIFDHGDYQHLLCKYDKWVSCNTVNRQQFFFWSAGSQPIGFENKKDEDINYSEDFSKGVHLIYGIVNEPDITKVELYINKGKVLVQDELYDELFYFTWESDGTDWGMEKIIGYNSNGEKVYEIVQP